MTNEDLILEIVKDIRQRVEVLEVTNLSLVESRGAEKQKVIMIGGAVAFLVSSILTPLALFLIKRAIGQ